MAQKACATMMVMGGVLQQTAALDMSFQDGETKHAPEDQEMVFDSRYSTPIRRSFLRFGLEMPAMIIGNDSDIPDWDITVRPVFSWLRTHRRAGDFGVIYGPSIAGNFQSLDPDPLPDGRDGELTYQYAGLRYNVGVSWQMSPSLRLENYIFAGGGLSHLDLTVSGFPFDPNLDPPGPSPTLITVKQDDIGGFLETGFNTQVVWEFSSFLRVGGGVQFTAAIGTHNMESPVSGLSDIYQPYLNGVVFVDWQF